MKTTTHQLSRTAGGWAVFLGSLMLGLAADAQTYIYQNLTTYEGGLSLNGNAGLNNGVYTTELLADDLYFAPGSVGDTLTSVSLSVLNLNSAAINAQIQLGFWEDDGTDGGPGTLLNGTAFGPASFSRLGLTTFTLNVSSLNIAVPPDGVLWVGAFFDNSGTTTTAAQLNELGLPLFNPPTIGSSDDEFFQSSGAGFTPGSNPAGAVSYFGGSPVANFGFAVQAVPEPSAMALGLLSSGGLLFFRRRR